MPNIHNDNKMEQNEHQEAVVALNVIYSDIIYGPCRGTIFGSIQSAWSVFSISFNLDLEMCL